MYNTHELIQHQRPQKKQSTEPKQARIHTHTRAHDHNTHGQEIQKYLNHWCVNRSDWTPLELLYFDWLIILNGWFTITLVLVGHLWVHHNFDVELFKVYPRGEEISFLCDLTFEIIIKLDYLLHHIGSHIQ